MNDVFEHWWNNNADLQLVKATVAHSPEAMAALEVGAGLAWNTALDLAKAIVINGGK